MRQVDELMFFLVCDNKTKYKPGMLFVIKICFLLIRLLLLMLRSSVMMFKEKYVYFKHVSIIK